jgi:hypothetical protein
MARLTAAKRRAIPKSQFAGPDRTHAILAKAMAARFASPRALALSPDAKAAWVALHDHIEAAMAPDGTLENLRDVGSKAAENAARIAGVLTIIENPQAASITSETMSSGCELAAWYVGEALRLSDAYRQSPSMRNAIRLRDWLATKGKREVSLREITQFGPAPLRQKAQAEAALANP